MFRRVFRGVVALVLLPACHIVFGLDGELTDSSDAGRGDGGVPSPDGAIVDCPPIGERPVFSTTYSLVNQQACDHFHVTSSGLAAGQCGFGVGFGIHTGSDLGALVPTTLTPVMGVRATVPRLDPSGTRMLVWETANDVTGYWAEVQGGPTSWGASTRITAMGETNYASVAMSTLSAGPNRRLVRVVNNMLEEWGSDNGGEWTMRGAPQALGTLGMLSASHVALDEAGIRLVLQGTTTERLIGATFYADRSDIEAEFSVAREMPEIGFVGFPTMAPNCAGLYFGEANDIRFTARTE